jgi:hypothetical protein
VDYTYSVTTGSSSTSWPLVVTAGGGGSYLPVTTSSGGAGGGLVSAPHPKTALEWLDDEIEAVCELARAA